MNRVQKVICHVVQHAALVVGVVLLTTALLSSYVRYETVNGVRSTFLNNEGRQKDFEDSKIFNELMKEQVLTIVRYGAIRGQLETDGVYDANKVIDITAYANRFEGVPNRYVTADYYLEDLIRWGKYGIEYADNASGKKVPVCHRISYDSVMDDEDFELVMENSDSESRAIFREEAKIIEENRKKYIQIAESEQPYDIYISYRAKDDNGDKTAVSEIAGHLYNKLTSARYRVFLSEAALKGKKQSDCEPYIYSALNSANVMLALGTSYDDYNDVWVKNEWNRYLEIAEKLSLIHISEPTRH